MDARTNILAAFFSIVSNKGFEAVTVREIIETADVSRTSFYRLFEDKYDLLEYFCHSLIQKRIDSINDSGYDIDVLVSSILNVMYEKKAFFQALYKYDNPYRHHEIMYKGIYEFFKNRIYAETGSAPEVRDSIMIELFAGGVMLVTTRWILSDMELTPDELTSILFSKDLKLFNRMINHS